MNTTTVRRPKEPATLPEWRRICHLYEGDSQLSICGVGIRKPGEDHYEDECRARSHTVCIVCTGIFENESQTR
jgi:hypothetical protein